MPHYSSLHDARHQSAELSRKSGWPAAENPVIVDHVAALTGFLP
jgi:hypothetical protein